MPEYGSNFLDAEFRNASHRDLTPEEWELAEWWRWQVLQPLRNEFGPIRISSYVRTRKPGTTRAETGPHKDGNAIDLVPLSPEVSISQLANRAAATALRGGLIAQVIDERDHVHLARVLVGSATGGYLQEPTEGDYRLLSGVPTPPKPVQALVIAVASGWIVRSFV